MQGNDFSWLATGFFIAYAVAEIPQGLLPYSAAAAAAATVYPSLTISRLPAATISGYQGSRGQYSLLGNPLVLFGRGAELRRDDVAASASRCAGGGHWCVRNHSLFVSNVPESIAHLLPCLQPPL